MQPQLLQQETCLLLQDMTCFLLRKDACFLLQQQQSFLLHQERCLLLQQDTCLLQQQELLHVLPNKREHTSWGIEIVNSSKSRSRHDWTPPRVGMAEWLCVASRGSEAYRAHCVLEKRKSGFLEAPVEFPRRHVVRWYLSHVRAQGDFAEEQNSKLNRKPKMLITCGCYDRNQ